MGRLSVVKLWIIPRPLTRSTHARRYALYPGRLTRLATPKLPSSSSSRQGQRAARSLSLPLPLPLKRLPSYLQRRQADDLTAVCLPSVSLSHRQPPTLDSTAAACHAAPHSHPL